MKAIRAQTAAAERFVRMSEVLERTRLSRATIYRKMARGEFPRSVQIGVNSVAWHSSDFETWLREPMSWQAVA
ncbi:AlpA family transcriptional regulator [uncultured Sphingomonas sp.]|uniref:helix-turn-helix transcriptional regulator n=1 Tax=uncultured Sphingomonas sp. TaxID=158754 RepID=UPI0025D60749|nr:AlpA family phage regulatory protein [uncultured Sphingomonas sp.]